jgi:hypothetical protein
MWRRRSNYYGVLRAIGCINKVKQSRYTPWRRLGGEEYSSYSFTTSALDGGELSASLPGRALPPGKGPPVPIVQEAVWASEPVWTQRLEEKSFVSAGVEPRSPGRPARSQTLHWLSYPAHTDALILAGLTAKLNVFTFLYRPLTRIKLSVV